MTLKNKVYIVTADIVPADIHSYSIVTVFSTKEEAEKFIQKAPMCYNYKIEEYGVDYPYEKLFRILVTMDKDGRVVACERILYNDKRYGDGFQGFYPWGCKDGCITWVVKTNDPQKAIEVVNEKRIIILDHNIWGNDLAIWELEGEKV